MNENIKILLSAVLCIIIFLMFFVFGLYFINQALLNENNYICDYDSCSQRAYVWEYNGSSYFDNANPDCREFLNLWRACEDYKKFVGEPC